ncbi:MAG: type I 3-dehydroquinate dehydratase [Candidatus Delongbacteria bacterium]|jgi:3-dehydroquinate dehydratase type I|nr:type I 3-dehydroquinate dehydratase [Candidatus Delongbacteria bacterium]
MIFVSISDPQIDKCIELVEKYKNVELRLDLIKPEYDDIGLMISKAESTICTYRDISDPQKAYDYTIRSLELGADIVDYSLDNTPDMIRQVVAAARKNGKMVMLSYHNFEAVPDPEMRAGLISEAEEYSPDLIKFAVVVSNEEEAERILELMRQKDNVIPVTMGETGKKGRLKAYFYGCPVVYAYPDGERPTAPGQLPYSDYKDMDKIIGIIYR